MEAMEGLKVSKSDMVVYLHPSKSTNVHEAVLRELSSLLFRFNEKFDGVVLAYEFDILDKTARILSGIHPYFCVKLKAKLLLFSPKPNMLLEGKVVKVTQESIHIVVLGFASVVIANEDIRDEFVYQVKHEEEGFYSKFHKRHVIKVGTMIRFLVKSFNEEIVQISGSLVPVHTGSIQWLAKHLEYDSAMDRNETMRANEDKSVVQDHGAISAVASSVSNHNHKIKNSKKTKRLREES